MTKEQIKDIAGNLECGFKCFVHRRTGDLKFFPGFDQYPDIDIDAWKDDIKLVK